MIGAGAEQHGSFTQEGEVLCSSAVSLETAHAGGGGHRPHPDLSGHRARAEHGGGGETEAADRAPVAGQRLRRRQQRNSGKKNYSS